MSCLLVSATAKEITPFLKHYRKGDNDGEVDILITGPGLTAATFAITRQIHIKRPTLIVQAGIAGCFDKAIPLGSVVAVKQEAIADLGVLENKRLRSMFDLGLIKNNHSPFKGGKLPNPHKDLLKQVNGKVVNAISVNEITTEAKRIKQYREMFQPTVESMEGAALHYTCLMENVPFLQIRAISNYIGERDKSKWNFKDALFHLNNEVCRLFNCFTN